MDCTNWQWTIVNWINCLSIRDTSINNISDLASGSIFFNLISAFTGCDRQDNISNFYKHVKTFLKDNYPNFKLQNFSIKTFSLEDSLYIASILLHYCCIVKIKDDSLPYKDHMVNLDETSQVNIYKYLQNIMQKDDISRESILASIPDSEMQSSSSTYNTSPCTPNQVKFNTQLNRLQEDLKSKLSEIFFLEESLKDMTEKYNALASEKEKYLSEIKKLKNNLHELEVGNKSPERKIGETKLLSQIAALKSEIHTKNEKLEELQLEIEHYEIEKQKMKSQLSLTNDKMIVLERTVSELQLKNDQLQLNIMDKCSEIKHLEEMCCELNLTVEQFKEINRKDVSVDELDLSLSQLPPEVRSRYMEETLAETVVDVQLHEKECEVNQLQDEIGEMKMDFERVCNDLKSVQAENVTLNDKTKELENCLSDMRISKEQVLQEKEILQTELSEKNKKIQEKDTEIKELVQSKCSQEEKISNLSRVAEQTNLLLTASVNKIQELEHFNADLTMRVSEAESALTNQISNLRKVLNDDNTPPTYLTITEADVALQELIPEFEKIITSNRDLDAEMISLKTTLSSMSNEIEDLHKLNELTKIELDNVNAEFEKSKEKVDEYRKMSEDYERELMSARMENEKLMLRCSEKSEEIEKLIRTVTEKDFKISMVNDKILEIQDKNDSLESALRNLENDHCGILDQYNISQKELEDRNNEIVNILKEKDECQKDNIDLKLKYDETKNLLLKCEDEVSNLEKDLDAVKVSNVDLCKEIENMKIDKKTQDNEIQDLLMNIDSDETKICELIKQKDVLLLDIESYKEKIGFLENDSAILKNIIEENNSIIIKLEKSLDELRDECETTEISNSDLLSEFEAFKTETLEEEQKLLFKEKEQTSKLSQEIENLTKEFSKGNQELFMKYKTLQEEYNAREEQFEKTSKELKLVRESEQKFDQEIKKLTKKYNELQKNSDDNISELTDKIFDLEDIIDANKEKLEALESEKKKNIDNYKELLRKIRLINNEVDSDSSLVDFKDIAAKLSVTKDIINRKSEEVVSLKQQFDKIFMQNRKLNAENVCYKNFVEETKLIKNDKISYESLEIELRKIEQKQIENIHNRGSVIEKLVDMKNKIRNNFLDISQRSTKQHLNKVYNLNSVLFNDCISLILDSLELDNSSVDLQSVQKSMEKVLREIDQVKNHQSYIEDTLSSHDENTEFSSDLIEISTSPDFDATQVDFQRRRILGRSTPFKASDYKALKSSYDELKIKYQDVLKKLEKNRFDEIIFENSKLQKQIAGQLQQLEEQSQELLKLRNDNEKLREDHDLLDKKYSVAKLKYVEYDEMKNKKIKQLKKELEDASNGSAVEEKVKQTRREYETKLGDMKARMKELYNNEMEKLNKKVQEEKSGLEALCKKYTDKIESYECQVKQISKELFDMGDKYVEEQSKNALLKNEISDLKQTLRDYKTKELENFLSSRSNRIGSDEFFDNTKRTTLPRSTSAAKHDTFDVIEEITTTTKRTVKPLSSVGSNIFMEDEDEVFNNAYLNDLKAGRCEVTKTYKSCENLSSANNNDDDRLNRLSELRWRNSLCPPHLRSSYATETYLEEFGENDVRTVNTSATHLLPSDTVSTGRNSAVGTSRWGKDRGQGTSYRKPGPPTPSKRAGRNSIGSRNSLQNKSELPRDLLKEKNTNDHKSSTGAIKKVKSITPNRIKAMFGGSKTSQNNKETERRKKLRRKRSKRGSLKKWKNSVKHFCDTLNNSHRYSPVTISSLKKSSGRFLQRLSFSCTDDDYNSDKRNAWRDPCEYPLIDSFSSDEDDDDVDEFSSYFNESYDSDHALRDQCMIEEINKEMEENLSIPPDNEMCKRKHEPLRNENNNRTDELSSKELVKNSSSNKVVKTPKEIFSRDSPNTKPVVIDVPSIKRSLRSLPIPNKSRHRTVIFYDENDQVKHFWCKENEFKILFVSLMVVVVGWMFVNWK